jgi:hydroxymethylglutaryl-CoA synthase
MQTCLGFVESNKIQYGLAIGADVSQSAPGDALEYTAGAGAGAFIIGKGNKVIAEVKDYSSFTSDTPDFWRRDKQQYPTHAGRFTGDPAYFRHTISAAKALMEKNGFNVNDFDHVVFHQPNGKFPRKAAKDLGFTSEQMKQGLVVRHFGNTYSACSLIGLANVLDNASPGQLILMVSFGSGAGSDAFAFQVTDSIKEIQSKPRRVESFANEKHFYLDYGRYTVHQKKINM